MNALLIYFLIFVILAAFVGVMERITQAGIGRRLFGLGDVIAQAHEPIHHMLLTIKDIDANLVQVQTVYQQLLRKRHNAGRELERLMARVVPKQSIDSPKPRGTMILPPQHCYKAILTEKGMHMSKIVIQGDITKFEGDAIVNAANESLMGGGGVDGAIHRVAGPALREECRQFDIILEGDKSWRRCATGDAKITKGHRLPAKHVIHTVGPVWSGGSRHEAELLASCYQKSLALAKEHGLKIIAFPSISTGAYMFPIRLAAQIAHQVVDGFLKENPDYSVTFVCFEHDDYLAHMNIMNGEVASD